MYLVYVKEYYFYQEINCTAVKTKTGLHQWSSDTPWTPWIRRVTVSTYRHDTNTYNYV